MSFLRNSPSYRSRPTWAFYQLTNQAMRYGDQLKLFAQNQWFSTGKGTNVTLHIPTAKQWCLHNINYICLKVTKKQFYLSGKTMYKIYP